MEFVVKNKLNRLNEKEKEIQKLFLSENDFWNFSLNSSKLFKTLFAIYALTTKHYWKIYLQNFNQIKSKHTSKINSLYNFPNRSNQISILELY